MSITFVAASAAPNRHHHRCDVAVFYGYVARRAVALAPGADVLAWMDAQVLPAAVDLWWQELRAGAVPLPQMAVDAWFAAQDLPTAVQHWLVQRLLAPDAKQLQLMQELGVADRLGTAHGVDAGLGVPWRCDSLEEFTRQFAWDQRPVRGSTVAAQSRLGASVRAFFAAGGASCWVIPMGPPPAVGAPIGQRAAALDGLLAGRRHDRWSGTTSWQQLQHAAIPTYTGLDLDVRQWRGREHLVHLDDVALFLLPDLGELLAAEIVLPEPIPAGAPPPERFWPCPEPLVASPGTRQRSMVPPTPHLDAPGRVLWRRIVAELDYHLLQVDRADVQVIMALPLAAPEAGQEVSAVQLVQEQTADDLLASRRLQLCWPWLQQRGRAIAPQDPSPIVAGILAAAARRQGCFRSIGLLDLPRAWRLVPVPDYQGKDRALADSCLTLIEKRPDGRGLRMRTDRSTDSDPAWRQAAVGRLFGFVMRSLRVSGRDWIFDSSGPDLWRQVRRRVANLLDAIHTAGGLRGVKSSDGYDVRCGRSTMSQADIDAGRLIVEIVLRPAQPIEEIIVRMDVRPQRPHLVEPSL